MSTKINDDSMSLEIGGQDRVARSLQRRGVVEELAQDERGPGVAGMVSR